MESPPNATPSLIFAPHEQDHSILNPGGAFYAHDAAPAATLTYPKPQPDVRFRYVVVDFGPRLAICGGSF
jgi:hypothetical protein